MSGKLITIATFSQIIDTELPKKRLESEGIECFIVQEHVFFMDWLYPKVTGNVKLQVNEANVGRAIEILKKTDPVENMISKK